MRCAICMGQRVQCNQHFFQILCRVDDSHVLRVLLLSLLYRSQLVSKIKCIHSFASTFGFYFSTFIHFYTRTHTRSGREYSATITQQALNRFLRIHLHAYFICWGVAQGMMQISRLSFTVWWRCHYCYCSYCCCCCLLLLYFSIRTTN